MTNVIIGDQKGVVIVPTSNESAPIDGHVQTVVENLADKRKKLNKHNRAAITGYAGELVAMHRTASGRVPEIRADRSSRYRLKELMGLKGGFGEEWWAVKDEGEIGLAVAMASLRVRAAAMGMSLTPVQAKPSSVRAALCAVLARFGKLAEIGGEALGDGTIDADERAALRSLLPLLKDALHAFEAAEAQEAQR
jgi:hypothetical protein